MINNDYIKNIKKVIGLIIAIGLVILLYYITGIGCPIKYVTGISCAGCGMTRAWWSFMQLDFKSAFAYHPLFFIPPTVVMILLYKNKINPRVFKLLIAICVVALLVVYTYRMLWHTDEIVVFEPQNGLVVRLFCS